MIITAIVLFGSSEADFFEQPDVFISETEMECVNQVKQHMIDCFDIGFNGESDESRTMFNNAGTYAELRDWFIEHYCSYDIKIEYRDTEKRTAAVLMPQE